MSRDAILAAAIGIVERDGLEKVTMRRLATELGIAPNALYTYFANKSALLDALLDTVLAGVRAPDPGDGSWLENLAALMRASRRALRSHPALVPLFVARPGGRNALRLGEATLQSLARGGVHGRRAVEALRALLTYTFGFAAMEIPRLGDPSGSERLTKAIARFADLPAGEYPATRSVATHLASHPSERDFESGLSWLLQGIAREARESGENRASPRISHRASP